MRAHGLITAALLASACAAPERPFPSEREALATEAGPAEAGGDADSPDAHIERELEYRRVLLGDPGRPSERFSLVRRMAEGVLPLYPRLVPGLAALAGARDRVLRAHALLALARLGQGWRERAPDLAALQAAVLAALNDPDGLVAAAAAGTAGALSLQSAQEQLRGLAADRRNSARRAAVLALSVLGDESVPGEPPGEADPIEHMRYLERVALLDREDLFAPYSNDALVEGRASPAPPTYFRDHLAPGLMLDLEHHERPCTDWRDGEASCRGLSPDGVTSLVRLELQGQRAQVTSVEASIESARSWAMPRAEDEPDKPGKLPEPDGPIVVFVTSWCPACARAVGWLREKGLRYEARDIERDMIAQRDYVRLGGKGSIPMLVVNDQVIQGFSPRAVEQALRGEKR